ncbi:hypothetical protein T4A_12199 [Trichinella pseudospiralis]|uniref:Uncharacterized protein n=1 Tax=Trichinella pseudospiralis TaxID=6337 RepID=A0A0V1EYG8_TRIPS|nr:hypothetical protein T4A_12199 [Trichinella pseudospiralis]
MRFRAFVNNYLSEQFFRMYFFFLNADLISENITSLNSAISSSSCKMNFYFFADCQRAVIDEQKISGEVYIFCYWKISMPKMLKGFTLLFCGAPILHFNLIL